MHVHRLPLQLLHQTSQTIILPEGIMHTPTSITLRICSIFSLLFLALPLLAHASLPKSSNVPGDIAIIQLGNTITHTTKPQAWFNNQAVLVQAELKQWYAVIGLPLNTVPGKHKLNVKMGDKTRVLSFQVKKKKYPEQHITIKDQGKVELAPEDEARAVREIATIKQLKLNWSDKDNTDLGFIIPEKSIGSDSEVSPQNSVAFQ